MRLRHPSLLLALAALLLTACAQEPRVKGASREEIDSSLEAIAAKVPSSQAKALADAVALLRQVADGPEEARRGYPNPYDVLEGRTPTEVIRLATKYTPPPPVEEYETFPNGVLATRMLKLYELQRTILKEARQDALLAGRSVIDQFPITDLQFVPPASGAGIDRDQATFRVTLLNNTRFDVYRPSFRITVKDGGGEVLFERVFEQLREKEPIGPGEAHASDLICCGILRDAFNNTLMRTLPAGATISASLVKVEDHSGRPVLETVAFTEADNERLHFLDACIEHLTPRLETWVPPEDGSECLSQAALEEWEMAQRDREQEAPLTASR